MATADFSGEGTLTAAVGGQRQTATAAFSGSGKLKARGVRIAVPEMVLEVLDPTLKRAPTAVVVTLVNGWANREIDFFIDDVLIWTTTADPEGNLAPTSINVPEQAPLSNAGTHTIRAEQLGSQSASATFTLNRNPQPYPIAMGPDAQAVDVPGVIRPNGTRAWVFQDLHPVEYGGIGSYVLPYNPSKMSPPYLERAYSTFHTTAPQDEYGRGGQWHIMQGGTVPKEWTFEGYVPDQEQHDRMLEYLHLNRRFYVIDHRKRAWKVVFTNIEFTARLHQVFNNTPTDWGHDYVVTATVFDQSWVVPA